MSFRPITLPVLALAPQDAPTLDTGAMEALHEPRATLRGGLHSLARPILGIALTLGLGLAASPAFAQWTRVTDLPAADVFSIRARGDTIAAATDTAVFVSTDGASWRRSARLGPGSPPAFSLWIRNGRLYAGTAGQGVFVSADLGTSWQPFNQGLVGGFFDSQLDVSDLQERGDTLYVATLGAGVYVRPLAGGAWSPFGGAFELNQGPNVNDLALGGSRLLACAGANGTAFVRDPGQIDWTVTLLANVDLLPGASAHTALWTGEHWVVGSNAGVFLSPTGKEPWTRSQTNLSGAGWTTFAQVGGRLYAALDFLGGALIVVSEDGGATWALSENLPGVFVYGLETRHSALYAARNDGLWILNASTASVPDVEASPALSFALAGPQPVGDRARLSFVLPEAASISIAVFDVQGREVAPRIDAVSPAGPHEIALDTHSLPAGVYLARLAAAGRSAVVRLVRVR